MIVEFAIIQACCAFAEKHAPKKTTPANKNCRIAISFGESNIILSSQLLYVFKSDSKYIKMKFIFVH